MSAAFRLGVIAAAIRSSGAPPAGGAPEFLDGTTYAISSRVSTHPVQLPATVGAGDLLLMLVGNSDNRNINVPVGWAAALAATPITSNRVNWIWKIASGAEGGTTQSIGFSGACYIFARTFRIAAGTFDALSPLEIVGDSGTTGLAANPPPLTPAGGAKSRLWIAAAVRTYASPTYTISGHPLPDAQSTVQTPVTGGNGMYAASCQLTSAVAMLDPAAYTLNAGAYDWSAFTIAIQPA